MKSTSDHAGQSITFANGASNLTVTGNGLHLFADNYAKQAIYAGHAGGYEVNVKPNSTGPACTLTRGSGALSLLNPVNFVNVQVECK